MTHFRASSGILVIWLTMFAGALQVCSHSMHFVSFWEGGKLVPNHGREPAYFQQIYNQEAKTGITIGSNGCRKIVLVDCACDGNACFCRQFSLMFLGENFEDDRACTILAESQRALLKFPVTILMISDKFQYILTSFGPCDAEIKTIPDGCYSMQ